MITTDSDDFSWLKPECLTPCVKAYFLSNSASLDCRLSLGMTIGGRAGVPHPLASTDALGWERIQRMEKYRTRKNFHVQRETPQIVKANWYKYDETGINPTTACESGESYYFYDAVGNVVGVLEDTGDFYRWEMDAFGNDLPGGNDFLPMDQPGPKEHLTGKMFDTATGLYYFHARWYDPEVGRFVSRDPVIQWGNSPYEMSRNNPISFIDPDGAMDYLPRTDETPICSKKDLRDEWDLIKMRARDGNTTNNSSKWRSCGQRSSVIAKAVSSRHGDLCCYDVAEITRKKFFPKEINVIDKHTVTVVKVKSKPGTSWDHIYNTVIDDWQFGITPATGWGRLIYYWNRSFWAEYDYLDQIIFH
jgi:RHS repeat-associated protein